MQFGELFQTADWKTEKHARRVEFLYTEVAFPQTDGE